MSINQLWEPWLTPFLVLCRDDYGGVYSNVKLFWNRYETKTDPTEEISIPIVGAPHGYAVRSTAQKTDMADLNPTGLKKTTKFGTYTDQGFTYVLGQEYFISHYTIIGEVKADLINVLKS